MDKAMKWLTIFLIVYALLGIAHLIFLPHKDKEVGPIQIEAPAN